MKEITPLFLLLFLMNCSNNATQKVNINRDDTTITDTINAVSSIDKIFDADSTKNTSEVKKVTGKAQSTPSEIEKKPKVDPLELSKIKFDGNSCGKSYSYTSNESNLIITTQCKPSVTNANNQGWKGFSFYASTDDKKYDLKNAIESNTTVQINGQLFTGFIKLNHNFNFRPITYDENNMPQGGNEVQEIVYQFENGKQESYKIEQQSISSVRKPVLYLYPEKTTDVAVSLNLKGHKIVAPYPAYNNGWKITAEQDGTITNKATGRKHYCLFWETEGSPMVEQINKGFVVKGSESQAFLETKLAQLGLTDKEANEFIIYWLPQMEQQKYNAVYFATSEYETISQLFIEPKPDALIRIMMLWQPLNTPIDLPEQILPKTPKRKGFVAVEWGGAKVTNLLP